MTEKRLLVVDDDADFGKLIARIARKEGFDVTLTTTAKAFMKAYGEGDYAFVIMDIVMPDMDGIELIRWLVERKCAAQIIVVSGYSPHFIEAAILLAHVGGLAPIIKLQKPLILSDVRAALTWPPHRQTQESGIH